MDYSKIPQDELLRRLEPPKGRVRMVLDTDTYNEVDDQFALTYAMLSPERLSVEAIYAAPFFNNRSSGPEDGMLKSYDEILRLLKMIGKSSESFAFMGARQYLNPFDLNENPAADDLIRRAMSGEGLLYVVAIGACTNVASAILKEPRIIDKIVVVWLGGHAFHWPISNEFNLTQDIIAARVLFDSGVPLVLLPCMGVVSHMTTTVPELEANMSGKNELCDYLVDIVRGYGNSRFAWSKVLWDITPIAWLIHSDWAPSNIVSSPLISDERRWSFDDSRHFIRYVRHVNRDAILGDVFKRLGNS